MPERRSMHQEYLEAFFYKYKDRFLHQERGPLYLNPSDQQREIDIMETLEGFRTLRQIRLNRQIPSTKTVITHDYNQGMTTAFFIMRMYAGELLADWSYDPSPADIERYIAFNTQLICELEWNNKLHELTYHLLVTGRRYERGAIDTIFRTSEINPAYDGNGLGQLLVSHHDNILAEPSFIMGVCDALLPGHIRQ